MWPWEQKACCVWTIALVAFFPAFPVGYFEVTWQESSRCLGVERGGALLRLDLFPLSYFHSLCEAGTEHMQGVSEHHYLLCFFFCLCRQGLILLIWLTSEWSLPAFNIDRHLHDLFLVTVVVLVYEPRNLLCRPGLPETQRDPPACAHWSSGLKDEHLYAWLVCNLDITHKC